MCYLYSITACLRNFLFYWICTENTFTEAAMFVVEKHLSMISSLWCLAYVSGFLPHKLSRFNRRSTSYLFGQSFHEINNAKWHFFYIQSRSWIPVFSVIYCNGRSCHLQSQTLLSPNKTLDYKLLALWAIVEQCSTPVLCKSNSALHLTNLFRAPVYHLTWQRRGDPKEVGVAKLMANSWRELTHRISQNSQPALLPIQPWVTLLHINVSSMLLLAFISSIQKQDHVSFIDVCIKEIPQRAAEETHITQCWDRFKAVAPIYGSVEKKQNCFFLLSSGL